VNFVVLEKAHVKSFIRTRKGKLERVSDYSRTGEKLEKTAKSQSKQIVDQMRETMTLFAQTESMCGPASMRIALSAFGKSFTEDELAKLAKSTIEFGTNHENLIYGLNETGVNTLVYEKLKGRHAVEVLRKHCENQDPVIVDWIKTKDGGIEDAKTKADISKLKDLEEYEHFSVVSKVDDTSVYLLDPLEDEEEKLSINYFMDRWFTKSENTYRWMVILNSSSEDKNG
jgi:ABC-type bacteriocin/lantibiotic exporter with double-glycine peptidase domain